MKQTVVVVGGGPAGLSAALHAAYAGAQVILVEKNTTCGAKLLLTGGGHANLGNLLPHSEWPSLFGKRGRFILPSMEFLPLEKYRAWLTGCGIDICSSDGFHLFPVSNSAKQVRNALVRAVSNAGIEIRTEQKIRALVLNKSHGLAGIMATNERIEANKVILCCGGKSIPATGSDGASYALAEQVGHKIRTPVPALVGLHVKDWNPSLAGLVVPSAAVTLQIKGMQQLFDTRELLLTHNGLSGPAVLDLSGMANETLEKGKNAYLRVNWYAVISEADWLDRLREWRKTNGKKHIDSLLGEYLPRKLAEWLCHLAGIPKNSTISTLTVLQEKALITILVKSEFEIIGSEGWNKAIITRGGIDLAKVDPSSLESKIIPGLYFAGEMLDIDGPCGGYNLHWAFASGALAGHSAAMVK